MAIDLDSGSGLLDRIGKLAHVVNVLNSFLGDEGTSGTLPKELNDALAEFDGASNTIRSAAEDLLTALRSYQAGGSAIRTAIRTACQNLLIEMADADNPLPERSVSAALDELIRQMESAAETVDANEPSAAVSILGPRSGTITGATAANPVVITSTAHGLSDGELVYISGVGGMVELNGRLFTVDQADANSFALCGEDGSGHTAFTSGGTWRANEGNGVFVVVDPGYPTEIRDGEGYARQLLLAEDIEARVATNTTAAAEQWAVRGEEAETDKLSHRWPLGSGTNTTLTTRDPSTDGFLTNGGFDAFTSNSPDNWTVDVGTPGTHLDGSANSYRGAKCLRFLGNGSTNPAISQDLSAVGLEPLKKYPLHVRLRAEAAITTGTLTIDLYDGTSTINNEQGSGQTIDIDLTALRSGVWQAFTTIFSIKDPLPTAVKLRVRTTSAISNTHNLRIDDLCLGAEMTSLYSGGPDLAIFAGDKRFGLNDGFNLAIANDLRGAIQTFFWRVFDLPLKPLPSATGGSETINDSLIG